MNYLVVCGWDRYQHYKDRDPPWVKLYRDILTTESWVLGDDTSRLVQVASILLAARYSNQIPLQWALIRKVASLDCSEKQFNSAVSHLCDTKFLEIQSVTSESTGVAQSAGTALATCTTETEQKDKEEKSRAEGETRVRVRPSKRCPQEFQVTADLMAWAEREVPGVAVASETENFRDHEFKDAHTDWPATWRKWMRRAAKEIPRGTSRQNSQPRVSALERVYRATEGAFLDDGAPIVGGLARDG